MIIYLIKNIINNKIYVGQTVNSLKERFYGHQRHKNGLIGEAIRKYGKDNFLVEEIETCETIEKLNEREIFWIQYYNSIAPNGYNLLLGGRNKIMHELTKKKLSEIGKTKTGKNHNAFGYKFTDEQREHQRKVTKGNTNKRGKKLSEETKNKLRKIVTCPNCNLTGKLGGMVRHHFDNCKN